MLTNRPLALSRISAVLASVFSRFALYGVDLKDPEVVAAIEAAVEAATAPLEAKNRELIREKRALQKGQDVKPEELERVETERDEWKSKAEAAGKDVKKLQGDLTTATTTLEGERGYTNRLLIDNGLAAALGEAGVKNPIQLKAAAAMLRAGSKFEVKVDGENRAALAGDKPLAEFVKAWAASDEGKHFVSAPANSGGNANGGGHGTPATAATATMTPVQKMEAGRQAAAAKT